MRKKPKHIPLINSTFYNEHEAKVLLCEFIMESKKLSMGDAVITFEKQFAESQGRKHATFFNSGSSANLAVIQALLNLGKLQLGDKVGFSAVTWATNVMPIIQLGLVPIPIDVNMKTLNVGPNELSSVLQSHKLSALFLTNLLGFSDDISSLCNIADSNNILLIEDNCESLGSKVENKLLGSFGIAATFSTFVGHHISTIEGGLTVTDSPELDEMLKIVRAHGWSRNLDETARSRLRKEYSVDPFYDLYSFYFSAFNLRPTEINGFLGSFALKYLDEIIDARESNYLKYKNVTKNCSSIWHYSLDHMTKVSNFAYPIIFKKTADSVRARKEFNSRGVEVRPIVGGNIAKQPFMVNFKTKHQLVNADIIHTNGVYLPNNPDLTEDDMRYLCDTFSDIVG